MHCLFSGGGASSGTMKRIPMTGNAVLIGPLLALVAMGGPACRADQPSAAAVSGFDTYMGRVEARLDKQISSAKGFLVAADEARLRRGELVIEKVTPDPAPDLPGAMLHHWRGTAFVPGARAEDFERLMADFAGYSRVFAPQVVSARVVGQEGDTLHVAMRLKQKHVLTVVLDTTYDIGAGELDPKHGCIVSMSTRIDEIADAGEKDEHALSAAENHGFLWRLNTYWTYEERDGGLYMQIETVSLTRAIPPGLGWAIGPFVESVPKESLEFTLRAVRDALKSERSQRR